MNVKPMNDNQPKAAITVSRMCSLLSISRSQFYWHVKKGTFHAPLRLSNGRPYFNASQVEDNLKGHLHESAVWRIVKKATKRAGINKDVSCHWFRHAHGLRLPIARAKLD